MRSRLVSDLHITLPQLDWGVRAAPCDDLVVLAGDHLDISSPVSLDAQSIRHPALPGFAARRRPCGGVLGHHDLKGLDEQGEQCALWPPFKPAGRWADRIGDTWVFNAGRQTGPVPAHMEIDLAAGSARWRSMMGSESLRLSGPAAPARSVF